MAQSNAINANTIGIVGNTGSAFPATAVTEHAVIVGGSTSSTLSNVGPGTAGQILQSGGGAADPAYSTATYPSTAGTSGNVLTSDGTNFVSSAPAASGFSSINIQTFTSSGTYTPTSGMQYCTIEVIGGGGGGGGVSAAGSSAGGGGGGRYVKALFDAAGVGASQTVTIGAAGTAGGVGAAGGTGGTTSVGTLITALGGTGGQPNTSNFGAPGNGGSSGTVSGNIGSAVNCTGFRGNYGCQVNGTQSGGIGANSQFGSGGVGAAGGNFNGGAAGGFGAGGGGGVGVSVSGGIGSSGLVIITEYI